MTTVRPLLHALLGLMLLVQGVAVAAAPHASADREAAAAVADTPCHGGATEAAGDDGTASCCDSDCPNMTSCLLGHFVATPVALLLLPAPHAVTFAAVHRAIVPAEPPFLLRPPIAHA